MPQSPRLLAVAALGLLAGCSGLRQTYATPTLAEPLPATWTYGQDDLPPVLAGNWWEAFNAPGLNALVSDVLARNNNLAAAGLRLRQARLQAQLTRSNQLPQPSGQASAGASRGLDGGPTSESYAASLGLSYELDLWGRLAALTDAAEWEAAATSEDLEATRLSLIGTTINLYFQIAYLNERLTLAQDSLTYAYSVQHLVQARYDAGSESGLAVQEARQTVLSQEATLSSLQQQRVEALNAIGVLLGVGNGVQLADDPASLQDFTLPAIGAGTPAALLSRRPDLRAAEARLRSTLANVDATRASFYPSFSLTGSAGGSSTALSDLFSNPVGSIGAALSLPFLNVVEQRLTNASARAGFQAAEADFRQTLATALSEVEDALSSRVQLATQGQRLEGSLDAARRAEQINEVRYRAGATSARDFLDSQESRRNQEITLLNNQLSQLNSAVTLFQALGGQDR